MRTLTRRRAVGTVSALACVAAGIAGVIGPAAAAAPTTPAIAGEVVPLADSGTLVGWGVVADNNGFGDYRVPTDLQGVALTSISVGDSYIMATTAAGKVMTAGNDTYVSTIPASLNQSEVVQIAAGQDDAAALTSDGKVVAWGDPGVAGSASFANTSALSGVASIAISPSIGGGEWGIAMTKSGGLQMWGSSAATPAVLTPPTGLAGVTGVTACVQNAMAVTSDGAVHVWGAANQLVTGAPSSGVAQVACNGSYALALNTNGTVTAWDASGRSQTSHPVPAGLQSVLAQGGHVLAIAAGGGELAALDDSGTIWEWGLNGTLDKVAVPASLNGAQIAELGISGVNGTAAFALVTSVLPAAKPTVTGTAKVGQTLTAKAGTFSGAPDSVTGQWLANGSPIAGATGATYTVKAGDVGKTISYRSTAKTGSDTVNSDSAPTAKVAAAGGTVVTPPPGGNGHTAPAQHNPKLAKDQAKLKKDQAKLKKAKKAKKKAHGAKKAKLQKKIKKLKKLIKADKKHIKADR